MALAFKLTCTITFLGSTCRDNTPVGTTSIPTDVTDSNMPTPDGTDTSMMTNADPGTSDPDSSQPLATTKGEFLNN